MGIAEPCERCGVFDEAGCCFCPFCARDLRPPEGRTQRLPCKHRVVEGLPFCPDCGRDVRAKLPEFMASEARKAKWGLGLIGLGVLVFLVGFVLLVTGDWEGKQVITLIHLSLLGLSSIFLGMGYRNRLWEPRVRR